MPESLALTGLSNRTAHGPRTVRQWLHGGAALAAAGLALCLAQRHPLWPIAMVTAWALWALWVAWQPGAWLWLLPAALPVANLSPWTGWLVFEEFDLLVLGALCALHARRWWADDRPPLGSDSPWRTQRGRAVLTGALWLLAMVGWAIGSSRAGGGIGDLSGFAAHEDPLWSLRASKGLIWALLLWPWMREELAAAPRRSMHRVGRGMLLGLVAVGAVVLDERLAYPGLYDFASHYRTTALFWEMHVGGAAIDAYLALATPFAAWALWRAHAERQIARWLLASLLAVLVTYACLTTFARGVYLATVASMLVLVLAMCAQLAAQGRESRWLRRLAQATTALVVIATASGLLALSLQAWGGAGMLLSALGLLCAVGWLRWRAQHSGWRLPATMVLATVLLLEVMLVLGGDSFMAKRIDDGPVDLDNRVIHWRHGMGLLEEPSDWLLGLGAGRFPAAYAASSGDRDFSGRLSWSTGSATAPAPAGPPGGETPSNDQRGGIARLEGPRLRADLGGLYAATQRIELAPGGRYSVRLTARATGATRLLVRVCERHLLYDRNCQSAVIHLQRGGAWAVASSALRGPLLDAGRWWTPRRGVFSVAVLQGTGVVEIDRLELFQPQGGDVLRNGDFSQQLAGWFPSAQRYYLPWHTDNLLLELLIERGLLGTLAFAGLLCAALYSLLRALPTPAQDGGSLVPVLMASLAGMLGVGLVSSVLDVPRLSFLVFFLALFSLSLRRPSLRNQRRPPSGNLRLP